jgi:hypothetical protein
MKITLALTESEVKAAVRYYVWKIQNINIDNINVILNPTSKMIEAEGDIKEKNTDTKTRMGFD